MLHISYQRTKKRLQRQLIRIGLYGQYKQVWKDRFDRNLLCNSRRVNHNVNIPLVEGTFVQGTSSMTSN